MKLKNGIIAAIIFLASPYLLHAQSPTVGNGGFENPALPNNLGLGDIQDYDYTSSSTTYLTGSSGWYVSTNGSLPAAGSVTLVNQGLLGGLLSAITGDASSQYLVLNGLIVNAGVLTPGALGGISQTLTTVPGQQYQVQYQVGALTLGALAPTTSPLSAGIDGVTVTSPTGGALVAVDVGTFQTDSFTFTADSTQSVLDFNEPSALLADVGGVAIDNVSITPVPEPSEYMAMFLVGGLGLMWIRRFRGAPTKLEA